MYGHNGNVFEDKKIMKMDAIISILVTFHPHWKSLVSWVTNIFQCDTV